MTESEAGASGRNPFDRRAGVDRREFLKAIAIAAASMGLPAAAAAKIQAAAENGLKPPVIWLHFQECTGCTESLLRVSHPAVADLILNLVSLDYHETLFAAAGTQAEDALKAAVEKNEGKYICVVEGSVPVKDGGVYCRIGGRTAMDILADVGGKAAAVIAMGSCASWGGVQSAGPNPTGAHSAADVLKFQGINKPVVSLPGCPPNAYNFLGVALQYATFGKLPALDALGRPMFAYGRLVHSECPRRAHFNAGRFAEKFGDENHRSGYCLYKLGCKGPVTHANCSVQQFDDVVGAWPVGIGHPCAGCTEKAQAFTVPIYETADIPNPRPSWLFPPVNPDRRSMSALATGVGGLVGGTLLGAGVMASKKIAAAAAARREKEEKEVDEHGG
jgi:hydrogenase small subunit